MTPHPATQKVAILLCTYHGQRYLAEQLDSLRAQTHASWHVWASDDHSHDDTHAILQSYQAAWGADYLTIIQGPAQGFADNFLSLTCHQNVQADYFAFSDQDDIWEQDKLARALARLSTVDPDVPALYCSRTRLVDVRNQDLGFSPLFKRPPGFANALMQNIGGGNTMVFNQAARALLNETRTSAIAIPHDWWAYLVISGSGGQVFYDPHPTVRYRQHEHNLIGADNSWRARMRRLRKLWQGQRRHWNDHNIAALQGMRHHLTEENRRTLDRFAQARERWLPWRLLSLRHAGIYMQTTMGTLGFMLAAIFKKL